MTDIVFSRSAAVSGRPRSAGGASSSSRSRSRLNATVMWIVFALLLLLPLALGGNRPLAWAIYTVLLSLLGTYYFAALLLRHQTPRIGFAEIGLPVALLVAFMLFIIVQALPLGGLLPASMTALPTGVPAVQSVSISPGDTILALLRWINIALIGYFSVQIAANSKRLPRFMGLLFGVVALHAVYGLTLRFWFGDTILFTEKWAYQGFATGGFVNRNSFATFLAIGACVGTVRLLDAVRHRPRGRVPLLWVMDMRDGPLLAILGMLMILIALIATGSRVGVLAAAAGMALATILFIAKRSETRSRRARNPLAIAVPAILLIGLLVLFGPQLIERFTTVEESTNVRMQLYEQVLHMISDRPWAGFGGGTFEYAYPLYHQAPVDFDFIWDRAHSSYLALWSEYGVIFGSLPMLAMAAVLLLLIATYLRSQKADIMIIAAIAATVTVAIHSAVDFSLEMHGVTLLYTALFAGAAGKALSMRQGAGEN